MYLSQLKLWNFRKFGGPDGMDLNKPDLTIGLNKGINLLVGENDSGKSSIIDAIKLVLKTHSIEWIRVEDDDFYKDCKRLRVECIFRDLKENEAKHFVEWLGVEKVGENTTPYLRLVLDVRKADDRILPYVTVPHL
jgi:putative ATP-dependent endonuclease of the OLD family